MNKFIRLLVTALCLAVAGGARSAEPIGTEYRSLSSGRLELWYSGPDSITGAKYLAWAGEYRPRPEFLAGRRLGPVRIVIAPDEAEFNRMSGGNLPEWGVAFALPEDDLVILRSPRLVTRWIENPRSVLNHELSHVFLDQQLRPAFIPRWFQEGYAVYCADMWDLGDMFDVSLALALGKFLPFSRLERDFPAAEDQARRAYLQSYTAVDYMFSNWDSAQLALIFERWKGSGDLDSGLRQSVGLTRTKYELNWQEWVGVRYGWLKLLSSVTLIWILAAGLFILVFVTRRRRYHTELEMMKRTEARYRISGPWAVQPPQEPLAPGAPVTPVETENESEED